MPRILPFRLTEVMFVNMRNLHLPLLKVNNLKLCSGSYLSSTAFKSAYKEKQMRVSKWNINFLTVGNGPRIVLLMPGALGSIWMDFKPIIEGFNKDNFTVIAWDPPGYGKSRPPEREFPVSFYEKDADYAFQFMKALNISKYSLVGWSDGGISSMIFAAKYPDTIEKLVIWGVKALILPRELEIYKSKKMIFISAFDFRNSAYRNVTTWSRLMRDAMIATYGEERFRILCTGWTDAIIDIYKNQKGDICSAILKDIRCPTFILYGQKDPIVDPSHLSYLNTHIKRSRLHLYPDGKHNLQQKYADDFNRRVQEFLLQSDCTI